MRPPLCIGAEGGAVAEAVGRLHGGGEGAAGQGVAAVVVEGGVAVEVGFRADDVAADGHVFDGASEGDDGKHSDEEGGLRKEGGWGVGDEVGWTGSSRLWWGGGDVFDGASEGGSREDGDEQSGLGGGRGCGGVRVVDGR